MQKLNVDGWNWKTKQERDKKKIKTIAIKRIRTKLD